MLVVGFGGGGLFELCWCVGGGEKEGAELDGWSAQVRGCCIACARGAHVRGVWAGCLLRQRGGGFREAGGTVGGRADRERAEHKEGKKHTHKHKTNKQKTQKQGGYGVDPTGSCGLIRKCPVAPCGWLTDDTLHDNTHDRFRAVRSHAMSIPDLNKRPCPSVKNTCISVHRRKVSQCLLATAG